MKISLLTGLIALSLGAASAWACLCIPPPSPPEKLRQASVVFVGHIVSEKRTGDIKHYEFAVLEVLKGRISATVTISTATSSAACGASFAEGSVYLVYATGTEDELHTNLCQANQDVGTEQGSAELTQLRQATGAQPAAVGFHVQNRNQ